MKIGMVMDRKLNEANQLFMQNDMVESLEKTNCIILSDNCNSRAFLLRARIYYKMGNWGLAMNDYGAVLEIEPENQEAKAGIEMAKNILGYFIPDMFNP